MKLQSSKVTEETAHTTARAIHAFLSVVKRCLAIHATLLRITELQKVDRTLEDLVEFLQSVADICHHQPNYPTSPMAQFLLRLDTNMPARFSRPICLSLALAALICPAQVLAQDDDGPTPIFSAGSRPFVYVMAASANRIKDEATYMFDVAGMPDAVNGILGVLDETVNGLSGLDWDRPAGMMVYLNSVFPPSFEVVSFLPVSSVEEFQSMMELGTQVMREEPNEPGRFELITPRRNIQIRIENNYAFIQMPIMEPDPAFDRDLPSPTTMVAGLANQFDLGITLDVEAVPKATRSLLTNVLTSTMSTQMQQRDEEAESTYELRKAWMQADIDAFKLMFDECQKMSFGVNVDSDSRTANIDFVIDVKNGGQLLEEILASSTKPSYFSPLLSDDAPVSLSWSGLMAERDRERYGNALEALKGEVARVVEEDGELGVVPSNGSPLFAALDALQTTAREGYLDMFGQFYNDSDGKLALVGALRIQDGEDVASGLGDVLRRVQEKVHFGKLTIGSSEHNGVAFHRLEIDDVDAGAVEIFGKGAGVTIGAGARTMWVCIGGDKSFDTLTGTMDQLVTAYENPAERQMVSAMRLVVKVNEVITLAKSADEAKDKAKAEKAAEEKAAAGKATAVVEEETKQVAGSSGRGSEREKRVSQWRERRAAQRELFMEALAEGDDRIELNARPTDHGMRMRASFEEGFIRGVGRMIGSRFSEN